MPNRKDLFFIHLLDDLLLKNANFQSLMSLYIIKIYTPQLQKGLYVKSFK